MSRGELPEATWRTCSSVLASFSVPYVAAGAGWEAGGTRAALEPAAPAAAAGAVGPPAVPGGRSSVFRSLEWMSSMASCRGCERRWGR